MLSWVRESYPTARTGTTGNRPRSGASPPVHRHAVPEFQRHEAEYLLGEDELAGVRLVAQPGDRLGAEDAARLHLPVGQAIRHHLLEGGLAHEALERHVERDLP